MQRERRDFPPSEGADDTGEVETAHLPVTGSTELSSNKYGFLNRLLLPRTRSPSSPLKTRGKDAGAFRDHAPEVGFRLISSSFSTETYGNALLSARDRDRDKRRWLWKPQLSTPASVSLFRNREMGMTREPLRRFSGGTASQSVCHRDYYRLVSS